MKDRLTILCGDALEQLKTLPDESVHCCVTSPPYWGLRDYGVPGQLGLEKTPEEYVAKMVEVFREVKRVLREDGTCWVNMGDTYSGNGANAQATDADIRHATVGALLAKAQRRQGEVKGLNPKNLVGIPWRVAFSLQADGWYLRSDIIWHKPNPMPESVTDRPTKSHEYLFLLSKNERYYFDQESIREPWTCDRDDMRENGIRTGLAYLQQGSVADNSIPKLSKKPDGWATHNGGHGSFHKNGREKGDPSILDTSTGRNKRSVWTVPTSPYTDAHFATYPPDLIKPCILAGTSAKGCCEKCGAPWDRQVESSNPPNDGEANTKYTEGSAANRLALKRQAARDRGYEFVNQTKTIGWKPGCECNAGVVPCTVLDCFGGSGTTGMVALELGRKAILIELNPEYVHLIKQRCDVTLGLPLA